MNNKKIIILIAALVILLAGLLILSGGKKSDSDYTVPVDITEEKRSELEAERANLQSEIRETKDDTLYMDLARVEKQLGLYSSAKRNYEEFLKKYPNDQVGNSNYAALLMDMGLFEEAEEVHFGIIEFRGLSLRRLDSLVRTIEAQNEDGSRTDDLISILEDASKELGQIDYVMTKLSELYEKKGECDLAIEHLEVLRGSEEGAGNSNLDMDIENLKARCKTE